MQVNKNHWYDGWFYDRIIAPNQDELFNELKKIIQSDSEIIDVGCGTGRLSFKLSGNCKAVLGIDLSRRNIERAKLNLLKSPHFNVTFEHSDIGGIINKGQTFDYAILTYVIHEVDKKDRIDLLRQIAKVADRIVIGDYSVAPQKGLAGSITGIIEFVAGREHYRNYRSYVADGGLQYLADASGLRIINEQKNRRLLNHIVVLAK
jgi:ubiquinone/menaquinone biosynthesis C-methylase UbiE